MRNMVIRVAVEPAGKPEFEKVELPGTGALSGPGAWRWSSLFQAEFSPGKHSFAVAAAGFRPDAIFLSSSDQLPTDDVIER